MRSRKLDQKNPDDKFKEQFRAVLDSSTSLYMYNEKKRSVCVIRKNLAKDYEIEVDASEAPVINKFITEAEPYESSMASIKILEDEIFPLIDAFKNVFGEEKDLKVKAIRLAVGSSKKDYVTIRDSDLVKFDVKPTLSGLRDFIKDNDDSILGFLDAEYVNEEGNVVYLKCEKKDPSENIYSIKIKILASMQQRGYFLQQEHKYYGLQLFITIETRKPNDDKLLEFLKELGIDWELFFFRRRLAIHDWTEIECEKNSESLKSFLRVKYDTLNFFDINNIIRVIMKNKLPFKVADKMASLLYKMKSERALQMLEQKSDREQYYSPSYTSDESSREGPYRSYGYNTQSKSVEDYSITLKKAEIAAAAKIACAYLGIQTEIKFDSDISDAEIMKYQEELTTF
jgi:hypothetical protein